MPPMGCSTGILLRKNNKRESVIKKINVISVGEFFIRDPETSPG
jgi:hypothetical protein